jgi:hypothetical protein
MKATGSTKTNRILAYFQVAEHMLRSVVELVTCLYMPSITRADASKKIPSTAF